MMNSNFLFLSLIFWFCVKMVGFSFSSKLLSYIFVREYPLSAVCGTMYFWIRSAMLPSIFNVFVLIGCSDSEREEMPNLRVELSRVLALNLLCPLPASSLMES